MYNHPYQQMCEVISFAFLKCLKDRLQFNHRHVLELHLNAKEVIQTVRKEYKLFEEKVDILGSSNHHLQKKKNLPHITATLSCEH